MAPTDRPGAVIAARLSILAAECADPDRFSRGKRYARDGAVMSLEVEQGVVAGQVQGSERTPYEVSLRWQPTSFRPGVVPTRDELVLRCTCPDLSPVCKHAVAVLVHLAEQVALQPGLLYTWRGSDETWEHLPVRPALHAVPDSGARPPAASGRLARPESPARTPEPDPLDPFFGQRATMWGEWEADDLDPFPDIVPLIAAARPHASSPVGQDAAALLDEVMAALTAVFG